MARRHKINTRTLTHYYQNFMTDMATAASENMAIAENLGTKVAIDEVSLLKGDLWTILSNRDISKCSALVRGTKKDNTCLYLKDKFTLEQRLKVTEATLDMSNSYEAIVKELFPNASMVIDRFHVQSCVYDAVQAKRMVYRRQAIAQAREAKKQKKPLLDFVNGDSRKQLLARSRYLLFKSGDKWTENQKQRAKILFTEYPELQIAYGLAQSLKSIYNLDQDKTAAKRRFNNWYEKVKNSDIAEMQEAVKTIQDHESEILNYFNNRSTNSLAENINSKIKLFKTLVRGINEPKYFIYRLAKYIA